MNNKKILEFKKNYNHIEIENKIVSKWEKDKLFYGFNASNKKIFSIDEMKYRLKSAVSS